MRRRIWAARTILPLAFAALLGTTAAPSAAFEFCPDGGPVATAETLFVDGAAMYLLTRGARCDAPAILWLHGGPGGAEGPLFRLFNRDLENDFVVAYWDQRGAGRSFDAEADPARLNVARHLDDLDHVIDHLRKALGRERILLLGHSWGSALGLLYAERHPGKVAAFVGVAQFVSGSENQRLQHAFVAAEARRSSDADAARQLADIGLPPYAPADGPRLERLVDRFGGAFHTRPNVVLTVIEGMARGYVAPWEIWKYHQAIHVSLAAMHEEILALDLRKSVPEVAVPVVFMLGRHDRQVDSRLAAAYFERLRAPQKEIFWFESSAHNVPFEEPAAFNARLKQVLGRLPAAATR